MCCRLHIHTVTLEMKVISVNCKPKLAPFNPFVSNGKLTEANGSEKVVWMGFFLWIQLELRVLAVFVIIQWMCWITIILHATPLKVTFTVRKWSCSIHTNTVWYTRKIEMVCDWEFILEAIRRLKNNTCVRCTSNVHTIDLSYTYPFDENWFVWFDYLWCLSNSLTMTKGNSY